jgi:ATP-dependent DNA helicase RecG
LKQFVERSGLKWDSKKNVLEKLGLLKDGHLVNAATLFFGKTPPMQLRCAVFGTTDSATIIDRHDFDGDILELIEEAQKYILKNTHIGMRLKGMRREDVPEISVDALREAIINAFCHRDYHDPDYVHIAVFKDRVEIRNPGGLFGGLTIEKMLKGHVSKRRNPLIADIFVASFERPSFSSIYAQGNPETKAGVEGKSEAPLKILALIRSNPEISIDQMSRELGITDRNIKRNLAKVKVQGLIERVGPDKGGSWKVCGG